ncbi:MAG TPA: TlpA disulfide reductase family protein, partial [Myxococcaceae bacterium]|nr:TlpA disulfide reductase family protein [Myxococcaceae bacterium]
HEARLLDLLRKRRTAVAFYASWCGPCQKELPQLIDKVGKHGDVVVVVGQDEDLEATRRALANLDLAEHGFFVDASGELQREARVRALPTTFLVTRTGAVLYRMVGNSFMGLFRLEQRLGADQDSVEAE